MLAGSSLKLPSGTASTSSDLSPLLLLGSKTLVGHSEPASGLTGVAYALQLLKQRSAVPVLHLRQLNPHVAGVISGVGPLSRTLAVPRAAAPVGLRESDVVGVSAFAFQVSGYTRAPCSVLHHAEFCHLLMLCAQQCVVTT